MPGGPSLSFMERMRGKRTRDIELPNESGELDPRLPRTDEAIRKAAKGFRELNSKGGIFDRVKKDK